MDTDRITMMLEQVLYNVEEMITNAEKLLATGFLKGEALFEAELELEALKVKLAAKRADLKELNAGGEVDG